MKIRFGFVSNSSSSSFVLVGVDSSNLTDKQKEELYTNGFEDNSYDDPQAIGVRWRASDYEVESISIDEINGAAKKLKDLGFNNVKVYFGEVYG